MDNISILVIEDNEMNMKLIRTLLNLKGDYLVFEATSAEAGIELMREVMPDIVLMDILLPQMNGLEATRIIKADPDIKEIPVVAVTSAAMAGDDKKAMEAGCIGHISKPIDVRNFISTMEQFAVAANAASLEVV